MVRKEFSENDKIKMLLWCDRHCCLCEKQCGGNIEIHHIGDESDDRIDNGIPLCFECHGLVHAYKENPKGSSFKVEELKTRRNQMYNKYTAYLIPTLKFEITQNIVKQVLGYKLSISKRKLPDVGFNISHVGGAFPVKVRVALTIFLGNKKIEDFSASEKDYYGGTKDWHLNPGNGVNGHFSIPSKAVKSKKQLRIKIQIKVIDIYGYIHELLPVEYIYMRDKNSWYLEP